MYGKIKTFLSTLLLTLSCLCTYGQYFTIGSDPARAKWNSIKTDHYTLIYPRETDSLARIYLSHLETQRGKVYEPLNILPGRLPVILHPYTTRSNGLVSWAPKRIELVTTPDPYDGSADHWITHLTLHEMRHVGQMEHYTKSIYRVLYYLLGEQISGLGVGLFTHSYMLEGDAVMAETELTRSGRGRSADFTKYIRTAYINDDFRNWDRYMFGSYRNYTPNHYVFGYTLGSYVKYETGRYRLPETIFSYPVKFWNDFKQIGRLFNPIRQATGSTHFDFFLRSQEFLSRFWKEDMRQRGVFTTPTPLVTGKRHLYVEDSPETGLPTLGRHDRERLYTEYTNGVHIGKAAGSPFEDCYIAYKTGMEVTPQLVSIDTNGKERFVRYFNPVSSKLCYDGEKRIYWSETVSNNTSELEDYSIIKFLDIHTQKIRSFGKRTKYFNPVPVPGKAEVAVVEYPVTGSSFLTILSSEDGKALRRYEAPEKGQLKEIAFLRDTAYCTLVLERGLAIARCREGEWKYVSDFQHQSISGLRADGEALYFCSDLDGVLNIYRYFPAGDSLIRITNSRYGANHPCMDTEKGVLYYSEFDGKGYRTVRNAVSELQRTPKSFTEPYLHPLAETLSGQVRDSSRTLSLQEALDTIDTFDRSRYPAKKYNRFLHAFRFHSWFPFYFDLDKAMALALDNVPEVINLGVTLLSQNSLGNVVTTVSYGYINRFHTGLFKVDARIWGNLSMEARLDLNKRNFWTYTQELDPETGQYKVFENKHKPLVRTDLLLYYPFSFNGNGWYRSLTPQLDWSFSNDRFYSLEKNRFVHLHHLRYGLSYGQILSKGQAQIYPRWGFGISAFGSSAPGAGENLGNVLYLNGYLYLPGITRTQGFKLTGTWQKQFSDDKIYFSSFAGLPRGYRGLTPLSEYWKVTLDYAFPIYLGDTPLGAILYMQRLQLIPFVDYARNTDSRNRTRTLCSAGIDVLFDFHIFRFDFPVSAGFRYAKIRPYGGKNPNTFEFLFNVSLQ